jgi:hypothetical protein
MIPVLLAFVPDQIRRSLVHDHLTYTVYRRRGICDTLMPTHKEPEISGEVTRQRTSKKIIRAVKF